MRVLCHQWLGLTHTIQNAVQLCSVHMLVRLCSKSFKLDFISKQTQNFQMYSGFWKGKWTRDQIANIHWIILKLRELKKKTSTSASLTMLKPLCSVQLFSRVWLFATPWTETPGLPIHHQLPKSTQTNVHWVSDAVQSSHPLSSPSPPALNLSQHQGFFPVSQLFTSGGQRIGATASTSVLLMNTQGWSPLG